MTTTKRRKAPAKWRRKLTKALYTALAQAVADRRRRKGGLLAANGSKATRGGGVPINASAGGRGAWSPSSIGGRGVPPMPAGYTATGWDGRPVTDEAALRLCWARECGYTGPIDQDGHPTDDWGKDRSGDLEWTDGDEQSDDQADTQAGESR